jgi:predicted RNA binding protein YcfA (HicA-like mRNA interferase family)
MPPLPGVSCQEAVDAFERLGWVFRRRESSHLILKKPGVFAALSVPDKARIADGTLRKLIRAAGISVEEFILALRKQA